MQTIYRLEARWTGGAPPAAVAAALDALPRYDGDALMQAVRALSPAAMHTGFLLHELRERVELRRVQRDEALWKLELRGPRDGQADVICVLDFLAALGFRHVSVSGPDAGGEQHVLSAELWRQRFELDDAFVFFAEDDDAVEDDLDDEADAAEEAGAELDDGFVDHFELHAEGYDDGEGNALPAVGPRLSGVELMPLRGLFAALASEPEGGAGDCLVTFAMVAERLQALHELHASEVEFGDGDGGAGLFLAAAHRHGRELDGDGLRRPLYAWYAGLAAQGLDIEHLGSLRLLVARAAQFTGVLCGLVAEQGRGQGDLSGLVGIAAAAAGFVEFGDD
ncbi:hypothetical protein [Arenimonas composti]|uniref:Uncharacterized protein n=1 Tax=Arenimonas composti TR7-09 = DSM 18010 TaxID=1121013 RepID=A0A091BV96_9GAMM|nr:hypothetical protein [Arenimonas composti]KFN48260.1 hypothetical protein P873_01505 [Arenimonas composti TR7-09 = DSM 18010]